MQNQTQVINALFKPEAYPQDPGKIELIQTHISFVFLTKNYVYKIKKAVNFGFLDFSTLEKRRFFCEKELELNRRLCPDIYLEVVPITKSTAITIAGSGETYYGILFPRKAHRPACYFKDDPEKMDRRLNRLRR